MGEKGVHIKEYHNPENLENASADEETIINEDGLETYFRNKEGEIHFFYDDSGKLLKKVEDKQDGTREIWTYEYDPDGNLLHVRSVEYEDTRVWEPLYPGHDFFSPDAFKEDYKFCPTGYTFDKWFYWYYDGKVCQSLLTFHYKDGTINKGRNLERYNENGQLMEEVLDSGDDIMVINHYFYREDGSLEEKASWFPSNESEGPLCVMYDDLEREIGTRENGVITSRIEYEDNEEGLWTKRIKRDKDGNTLEETVRVYEVI